MKYIILEQLIFKIPVYIPFQKRRRGRMKKRKSSDCLELKRIREEMEEKEKNEAAAKAIEKRRIDEEMRLLEQRQEERKAAEDRRQKELEAQKLKEEQQRREAEEEKRRQEELEREEAEQARRDEEATARRGRGSDEDDVDMFERDMRNISLHDSPTSVDVDLAGTSLQEFVNEPTIPLNRFRGQRLIEDYIKDGRENPYPDSLEPTHGSIYIFEMENKSMNMRNVKSSVKALKTLDDLHWRNKTLGVSTSGNTEENPLKLFTFRGKDKSPLAFQEKKIMMDYTNHKVVVHYFKIKQPKEQVIMPTDPPVHEATDDITHVQQIKARPYMRSQEKLSRDDITDLFNKMQADPELPNSKTKFIENPRGGEVFLFDINGRTNWRKELHVDSHKWSQRGGEFHPMDGYDGKLFISSSWNAAENKYEDHCQLQKNVLNNSKNHYAVIHYVGSSEKLIRGPHGNSKDKDRVFMTTNLVVVADINARGLAAKPSAIRDNLNSTMAAGTLDNTNSVLGTMTLNKDKSIELSYYAI